MRDHRHCERESNPEQPVPIWIASALTRLASRPSLGRDDLLTLLAQSFDAQRDYITDVEELRRLHAGADARGRAGGDDIARQQCHELRDIRNALRHREDHGRGRSGLATVAIDVEPHRQLLHVRYLIFGHQPWADRTEGVVRLALGPLTQTLDLEIPLGHVIADAVARDVIERV